MSGVTNRMQLQNFGASSPLGGSNWLCPAREVACRPRDQRAAKPPVFDGSSVYLCTVYSKRDGLWDGGKD